MIGVWRWRKFGGDVMDSGATRAYEEPQKEACPTAVGGLYQGRRCILGGVRLPPNLTRFA